MKKILLITYSLVTFNLTAQNVPNRGFEIWEDRFILEQPDFWKTSNQDQGIGNVSKSEDKHSGMYAMKLANAADSSFGYFFMGTTGDNGPDGGHPYTSYFDSVVGWYKCDMKTGDTALVLTFKYSPTDSSMTTSRLYGTINTWTRFAFPLATDSQTTVFFGVVSTNPFGGGGFNPNSWILIDDVSFVNSGSSTPLALPNSSFEDWDSIKTEEALGWNSVNYLSVINGDTLSVQKSTDARSGEYAMKIKTADITNQSKVGWAFNGSTPGPQGFTGGFSYNSVPTSLEGYYKYTPVGLDSGLVAIIGSVYDSSNDTAVNAFISSTTVYNTASKYVHFDIPISYDTTLFHVNRINIVAVSSKNLLDNSHLATAGTELLLDDLWLNSKCAYSDTIDLFAFSDTTITFTSPDTPTFSMVNTYVSYKWNTGDSTPIIQIKSSPANLSVVVTDGNGCEITDQIIIYLDDLSSLELKTSDRIKLYPNPVRNGLTFIPLYQGSIRIYDMNGRLIKSKKVPPGKNKVTVGDLPNGPYIFQYVSPHYQQAQQMIFIKE